MRHYYTFPEPFELELGGKIQNLTIAYDTYRHEFLSEHYL